MLVDAVEHTGELVGVTAQTDCACMQQATAVAEVGEFGPMTGTHVLVDGVEDPRAHQRTCVNAGH
jgi:catabolite regulation protein CreA